jgi:hypothetical protein
MSDTMSAASDFAKDFGAAVSRNPLPAALIGMGLVWLFAGRPGAAGLRRSRSADSWSPGVPNRSLGESVSDYVGSGVSALRETGAATAEKAAEAASSLGRSAANLVPGTNSDLYVNARSALAETLQRQPLLLGAMGLAIGAGVAASLPITRTEADFLGETSANLQEKARAIAMEQTKRAGDAAQSLAGTAADEARHQGLTPEGVRGGVAQAGQKIENLVEGAVSSVKERIG